MQTGLVVLVVPFAVGIDLGQPVDVVLVLGYRPTAAVFRHAQRTALFRMLLVEPLAEFLHITGFLIPAEIAVVSHRVCRKFPEFPPELCVRIDCGAFVHGRVAARLVDKFPELTQRIIAEFRRKHRLGRLPGAQLADDTDLGPHAKTQSVAQCILLLAVLIMRHSDRIAAHIPHHGVVTLTLLLAHRPAALRGVLVVIHAMQRHRLPIKEESLFPVKAEGAHAELL